MELEADRPLDNKDGYMKVWFEKGYIAGDDAELATEDQVHFNLAPGLEGVYMELTPAQVDANVRTQLTQSDGDPLVQLNIAICQAAIDLTLIDGYVVPFDHAIGQV